MTRTHNYRRYAHAASVAALVAWTAYLASLMFFGFSLVYWMLFISGFAWQMLADRWRKKARQQEVQQMNDKFRAELAEAEARKAAAIENGPETCHRTGAPHIFIGAETVCINGCGVHQNEMREQA